MSGNLRHEGKRPAGAVTPTGPTQEGSAPMPSAILEERVERGIYRRGDKYVARVRTRQGKLVRVTGRTLTEIRRLKQEAEVKARAGGLDEKRSTATVSGYFEGWLATHDIRDSTRREYRKSVKSHVLPEIGKMRLTDVERSDVRALVAKWERKGVGRSAQRNALAPVAAMFSEAVKDDEVETNPCAGITVRKAATVKTESVGDEKALSDDEIHRLRSHLSDEHRFLVDFLTQTGLRIGEALELRWRDVEGDVICVRRAVYEGTVSEPKTRNGRRRVRAGRTLSGEPWRRRKASQWPQDDGLVFPSRVGTRLSPRNVHRWFKPAAEKAGVKWASPHSLRHTCGSRLIEHGVDVVAVSRWLGHASVAFTLSVYTHQLRELPDVDLLGSSPEVETGPLRAVREA